MIVHFVAAGSRDSISEAEMESAPRTDDLVLIGAETFQVTDPPQWDLTPHGTGRVHPSATILLSRLR